MKSSYILGLCYGGMVCVAIGVNLLPVYFTTFAAVFGGLNEEQLGRIPAVMFAGVVVGIMLSGPLADRFGARLFTVSGMAVAALGLLLMSVANGYGTLLAAGAVSGLGAGILDMVMSPIVSAVCMNRRAAALNRLHAFYCIGAIGTVLVAAAGLYFDVSWRLVAASLALIPLGLLAGFAVAPLPPLVHPDHRREGLRRLIRRPRFLLALVIIVFVGATEAGMVQWLPAYAERVLGYSKASGGAALAAFSIAMAGGRLLASHRLNRLGPHMVVIVAGALCAVLYFLGALLPVPPLALTACVLVGFACSALWPTCLAITADRFPSGGASMFALLAAAGNIGCLVIPWMIGLAAERTDLRTGILAGSFVPVLLALVAVTLWGVDRRTAAASPQAS